MDQQGNPIAGGSGLNQQQIQPVQPAIQGNNDAANLARQIQANTNVTMKTEVVKLPDFYGDPTKDTITALEFMAGWVEFVAGWARSLQQLGCLVDP